MNPMNNPIPAGAVQALGNGKFMTPNGIFDSYEEAINSVGGAKKIGAPRVADPVVLDAPVVMPQNQPQQPQPKKESGMFGGLLSNIGKGIEESTSGLDLGGIGKRLAGAHLALSQNPNLAAVGRQRLSDIDKQKIMGQQVNKSIEALRQAGYPEDQIQMLAQNPELLKVAVSEMIKSKYKSNLGTEEKFFNNMLEGMTEEDIERAKRIKLGLDARAGSMLNLTPEELATRSFYTTGGTEAAKQEVENAKLAAGRAAGKRMFDYALGNLEENLLGTTTGKLAGFLPAITSNQQLADQSIAMMAPILKQTFRAAGEGVFTDKDQELLMSMLPDRGSNPAVIKQAIQNLSMLINLKLETGGEISDLASRFGITTGGMKESSSAPSTANKDSDPLGIR